METVKVSSVEISQFSELGGVHAMTHARVLCLKSMLFIWQLLKVQRQAQILKVVPSQRDSGPRAL